MLNIYFFNVTENKKNIYDPFVVLSLRSILNKIVLNFFIFNTAIFMCQLI